MPHLLSLFAFLLLAQLSTQLTSPMSNSLNRKFMNNGVIELDLVGPSSWNPNALNVTYPFSFGSTPVSGVFLSINDMNLSTPNLYVNYSFYGIVNSFTQTSFSLYVYSNSTSNIVSLGYRYMVFAIQNLNLNSNNWIQTTIVQAVSIQNSSQCASYNLLVPLGGSFNLSASSQYAISFLGYDVYLLNATFEYRISLQSAWYNNKTNVTALVYFCGRNMYGGTSFFANMSTVHFNLLIHSPSFPTPASSINSVYISSYNTISYPNLYEPSTLVAMNWSNFTTSNKGQFMIKYNQTTLELHTANYLNIFGLTVTNISTFYCPYTTPYFNQIDSQCYDVCPAGTNTSQPQLACLGPSPNNGTSGAVSMAVQVGSVLGYVSCGLLIVVIVLMICLYKKMKQIELLARESRSQDGRVEKVKSVEFNPAESADELPN